MFIYSKYEFSVKVYYLPPTKDLCNLQVCCSLSVTLLRSQPLHDIYKGLLCSNTQNIKVQRTFFFITAFCFALGFKKYTRHLIRKFTNWYHLESCYMMVDQIIKIQCMAYNL